MTKTRYLIRDLGGALTASALLSFIAYLPPDSALRREINPDVAWLTDEKVALLLAGIHDQLNWLHYSIAKANGGHPKKPKPLPRPGVTDNAQKVGRDPRPIEDFDAWYYGGD